jgi:hypothetical protein
LVLAVLQGQGQTALAISEEIHLLVHIALDMVAAPATQQIMLVEVVVAVGR